MPITTKAPKNTITSKKHNLKQKKNKFSKNTKSSQKQIFFQNYKLPKNAIPEIRNLSNTNLHKNTNFSETKKCFQKHKNYFRNINYFQ